MRLCSVTIYPSGGAIRPAVDTVASLVDEIIAIPFEEPIEDFAAARNLALSVAQGKGYDWALVLDTDERLRYAGVASVRILLNTTDLDVVMVPHLDGSYEKERFFRLPARGHFHGRTHEAFLLDEGALRGRIGDPLFLAFDETPKDPDHYQAKVERDRALLISQIIDEPTDPRWHYYLGDTYEGLGQQMHALKAFERCWELNGWDEESAWAAYRVASIRATQHEYDLAIMWCTRGMRRYPGMAELPWLAGYCCYQLGQHRKAIWWEEMAKTLNNSQAHRERIGFRHPPALFEGPLDVMRHAYTALGDRDGVAYAEERFQDLLELRHRQEKQKMTTPAREA